MCQQLEGMCQQLEGMHNNWRECTNNAMGDLLLGLFSVIFGPFPLNAGLFYTHFSQTITLFPLVCQKIGCFWNKTDWWWNPLKRQFTLWTSYTYFMQNFALILMVNDCGHTITSCQKWYSYFEEVSSLWWGSSIFQQTDIEYG